MKWVAGGGTETGALAGTLLMRFRFVTVPDTLTSTGPALTSILNTSIAPSCSPADKVKSEVLAGFGGIAGHITSRKTSVLPRPSLIPVSFIGGSETFATTGVASGVGSLNRNTLATAISR